MNDSKSWSLYSRMLCMHEAWVWFPEQRIGPESYISHTKKNENKNFNVFSKKLLVYEYIELIMVAWNY